MFNKIKAIKDLRDQAKKMQSGLAEISTEGSAAWGKVTVKIDGNLQVLSININEEMLKDKKKLEETVQEAVNDAIKKIQKQMALKMKDMGGLEALKNLGI